MSGIDLVTAAVQPVSADWLALRETEDGRARSMSLARALAELMGGAAGALTVHDLGSGTGSMMRWLAPILPSDQRWVLHDWDPALTARALSRPPLDGRGRPVTATARQTDLARLTAADLAPATPGGPALVVASALLDVLTLAEVTRIVDACRTAGTPALFSLSVTGEVALEPSDRRDAAISHAFNAHQRRQAGVRRLLGPDAGRVARQLFAAAGWHTREERTTWRLGPHEPDLLAQWLDGWVGAAGLQDPELGATAAGRAVPGLRAAVHHTDLLAWPR